MTTALVALSFLGSCAIEIHDFQACSPLPESIGAVCDNFLTSNPQTLTEDQWNALQASWLSQGLATECINSTALANIKIEIEQLCSTTTCDPQAKAKIIQGLAKIGNLHH